MGTLEGEASIELNIDESRCVILVLIRDGTRGQPVGSLQRPLAFFFAFSCIPPTQIHFRKEGCPLECWRRLFFSFLFFLSPSLIPHSRRQELCRTACSSGHLWASVIAANQSLSYGRTEGITAGLVQHCIMGTAEV